MPETWPKDSQSKDTTGEPSLLPDRCITLDNRQYLCYRLRGPSVA